MSLYRANKKRKGSLRRNVSVEGETLEFKIERMLSNGEPLNGNGEAAQMIFTDRKDGVMEGYNPRTDRWEIAVDAASKVGKSKAAKRDAKLKEGENGETESIQGEAKK